MTRLFAFGLLLLFLGGCGGKGRRSDPGLTWPPPPETPRIKFLGTLTSSEDVEEKGWATRMKETLFGSSSAATLVKPYAVFATRNDRLYVADSGWRKVLVFDTQRGRFFMIGVDGPGALSGPLGVTADRDGRVYVTDTVLRKCLVYDSEGKYLFDIGDLNQLERPVGIAVNNDLKRVYIADTRKHKIFVFDFEGNFLSEFGKRGIADGEFNFPANLFVDRSGKVYVFGEFGSKEGQLWLPAGLTIDSQDRIYVADQYNHRIDVFQYIGPREEKQEPILKEEGEEIPPIKPEGGNPVKERQKEPPPETPS
jgi:DNA-binding beta-propeller fold protein YncE